MQLTDTRRLTGPSLLLDGPGAIAEVACTDDQSQPLADAWRQRLLVLCEAVGWAQPQTAVRIYGGGASLAFAAPIDALYAATEVNETAIAQAIADLGGDAEAALGGVGRAHSPEAIRASIADEANPALLALEQEAAARDVDFLWDDDEVSVGLGRGSITWPVADIPSPEAVDWDAVRAIPTCIITGTNGKSTTSRMVGAVVQASGATPGATSTDGVMVGNEWVERGDFSGPGGARTALRDPRVEVGVLEVARGGILRRGLGLPDATAVAVTNVADDHLGDYGIDTVPAARRGQVRRRQSAGRGRRAGHQLGRPALPPRRAAAGRASGARGAYVVWTGLAPEALPDGPAVSVVDGWIVRRDTSPEAQPAGAQPAGASGAWTRVVEVTAIPATRGGAAKYNVRNALTACGLAHALGLSDVAIARGLGAFASDVETNPGRGNVFSVNGATVWIDFAHNTHGLRALVETVEALPSTRRIVQMSHAGDRSDREIRGIATTLNALGAEHYIVADMPDYLRGRTPGEIPMLQREALLGLGVAPEAIHTAPDPASGVRQALALAEPGDVLMLMVLARREEAIAAIRDAGGVPA